MQSEWIARPEFWRGWEGPHVTGRFKLRGQRRCVATGWQNRRGRIQSDGKSGWRRICTRAIPRYIWRNTDPHTDCDSDCNSNAYCDPECNAQPEPDAEYNT